MKYAFLFMLIPVWTQAQSLTTDNYKEKRWLLNSGVNLPAAKFHLTETQDESESRGFLELFSSFGVGLSINYGDAQFTRNIEDRTIIEDRTEFVNLIGFQCGILYSSQISEFNQNQINIFSFYSGINILDLQLGGGYEIGSRVPNSNGWFVSVSYGIPIYKISGSGSYLFKKKETKPNHDYMDMAAH